MKVKPQRRSAASDQSCLQWLVSNSDTLAVTGYRRLVDSPDVLAAVGGLADIVSNATIQLFRNAENGDIRVRNELSRFVDIHPWRYGGRKDWVEWIVETMLLSPCGSAFVLPQTQGGLLVDLTPMPGATVASADGGLTYFVTWRGKVYDPADVLHFKYRPDPDQPWLGLGLRASLRDVTGNLRQASATKKGFMSDKWKPSVIVKVDGLSDEFSDEAGRKRLMSEYLQNSEAGAPWIIPAELMDIQQVKPLSLSDLALKDGVELDKREVAAIVGVTPYMLGVGNYSDADHNHMIRTTATSIANIICSELTRKLLLSPDWYFKMSVRRLYSYTLKDLADVSTGLYVKGIMSGNESRDWLDLSPVDGLDERVILENYIPANMIGNQKKLEQGGEGNGE